MTQSQRLLPSVLSSFSPLPVTWGGHGSSTSTSRSSCRDLVHLGATAEFIYLLVLLWFVAGFVILD